jgi:hypothetical protein
MLSNTIFFLQDHLALMMELLGMMPRKVGPFMQFSKDCISVYE